MRNAGETESDTGDGARLNQAGEEEDETGLEGRTAAPP